MGSPGKRRRKKLGDAAKARPVAPRPAQTVPQKVVDWFKPKPPTNPSNDKK